MEPLYPLRFKEILRNYGFGGRWMLDVFEKESLPADHRLAETWEVCDRPGESSEVINGHLRGKTLHELIDLYDERLLGRDVIARCGRRFPLLIKFLDASHTLNEQVHQGDELARAQGLTDPGKTEAWYMLHIRDGATVRCGARPGVSASDIHDALADGTIREYMQEYPVQPGDAFLLYAGAMHYTRGGVLFYEIMQNSDVIIGLRKPDDSLPKEQKEAKIQAMMSGIHLEEGFDCKIRPVTVTQGANRHTWVFACAYFALKRLDLQEPCTIQCDGRQFYVISQIQGRATVSGGSSRESLRPGRSCLLPADLGAVQIEPDGPCALLQAWLPNLAQDVVTPLRQAGITDHDIVGLGGQTRFNPLIAFL